MKLPNAHLAVVDQSKIVEYLLNAAHPDNGGKAVFLQSQGFAGDSWQLLADALLASTETGKIVEVVESSHGTKYVLDVRIDTPSGKRPLMRTVWIVDRGLDAPRLVTAYPREK